MAEKDTPKGNKRTVEALYTTYINAKGLQVDAVRGDEIEVHQDDLERYDRVDAARSSNGINP
jgi:hypothetical protein